MPPRRPAQDAPACVCAARDDVDVDELFHPSRSVFYVPAPRWPRDMAGRRLYETAFDCKVARSDDDLDDFDRVSNHPALMQAADRAAASSSSSAVDTQDMRRSKLSGRSDSSRRSKQPINRQQQLENDSNTSMISEEMENMHLTSGDDQQNSTTSQLPLRGYTPSPPSTAPLPTKFQQSKDYLAMNSIKSAPNLPSQPAHPRLKDLRLPVKSLRARETPMSSDMSIVEITGRGDATSSDFELGNRLRNMIQDSQDRISESKGRPRLNNGLFLEIKGRPISDSDTPDMNRFRGSKESGPILEFKGRPRRHIRHKYSSTESMATSSSGGSMESIRSSTSEGNRSTSSSESRHSSTISSHSSDSSNNTGFPKMHHGLPLSGFISHHANKLHILSPISDKSSQEPASETSDNNKNNNSQKVSPDENGDTANCGNQTHIEANVVTKPKRRIPQNRNLLNLAFQHSMTGDTEIQGSDSGISIHSRDGVNSRNAFLGFLKHNQNQSNNGPNNMESNNCMQNDFSDLPFDMPKLRRRRAANQSEAISGSTTSVDLRNLPFDMPKLRRKLRGQTMQFNDMESSGVSQASSSQSVQELEQGKPRPKLTLNFEGKASGRESFSSGGGARSLNLNFSGLTAPPACDTFDSSLPLERQGWYHGAISRIEAESILRVASEGTFLVRNSESTKQDYSLSLKSARGFMHMRIQRSDDTGQYILGQFSKPFPSIPDMIRHYCANRLPVRGAEHMCLVKPLIAQLL